MSLKTCEYLKGFTFLASLWLLATPLAAQSSLSLSSVTGAPGSTVSMVLSVATPSGTAPSALEWTLGAPAASVTSFNVVPDASLQAAGKSVNCTGTVASYTCVLSGGNAVLADGAVADVSMTLSSAASTSTVALANDIGVSAVGGGLTVTTGTGGVITVSGQAVPTLNSIT